jgi:hypothetical protein
MLATDTLLRQVDTLLSSGYQAQAVELPQSASANFADAGSYLRRARRVFFVLGAAGAYQPILNNFGRAVTAYAPAVADAARHSVQSQREAAGAYTFLSRAEDALNATPEAGQPATLAAESAALSAVAPPPPVQHRAVHHRKGHHSARLPAPRRVFAPARHAIKAAPTPKPTSAPPTATATPKPRPTNTPVPPAPTSTPRPPLRHRPSTSVLATLHLLAAGDQGLRAALHRVHLCQAKLASLGVGNDPTGSAAIQSCLTRAAREVGDADTSIKSGVTLPAALKGALVAAHAAAGEAETALVQAQTDVTGVDLLSASHDLAETATALRRARQAVAGAEHTARSLR